MSDYKGVRYVEVDSEQAGTPEYVVWLEAKLSKMEEVLHEINMQATRKDRATDMKRYLLTDLDRITTLSRGDDEGT